MARRAGLNRCNFQGVLPQPNAVTWHPWHQRRSENSSDAHSNITKPRKNIDGPAASWIEEEMFPFSFLGVAPALVYSMVCLVSAIWYNAVNKTVPEPYLVRVLQTHQDRRCHVSYDI